MIPKDLADCFSRGARERGERYFTEGRIEVLHEEPLLLRTIAHGTEPWLVTLDARDPEQGLLLSCACPFAQDSGFCKHLWATLRFADQRRRLAELVKATHGEFAETSIDDDASLWDSAADQRPGPPDRGKSPGTRIDRAGAKPRPRAPQPPAPPPPPAWQRVIQNVTLQSRYETATPVAAEWPSDRRLVYIVDLVASSSHADGLVIELATEKRGRDGEWEVPKLFRSGIATWRAVPDPVDREIGEMLRGCRRSNEWTQSSSTAGFVVTPSSFDTVLRLMSETGRLRIRHEAHERPVEAATWDSGAPWRVRYRVERRSHGGSLALVADLERAGETLAFDDATLLHNSGFVVHGQTIGRAEINGPYALVAELWNNGPITLEEHDLPSVIGSLSQLPRAPRLELPEDVGIREVAPRPVPVVSISRSPDPWRRDQLQATLAFDYNGLTVGDSRSGAMIFDSRNNQIIRRDVAAETAATELLKTRIKYEQDWRRGPVYTLGNTQLETLLRELTEARWRVLVEGVAHRASTAVRANVSSGVDWFDLEVDVTFGDTPVPLPMVLAALREKQSVIALEGGVGLITADLRKRLAPLLAAADGTRGLRFRRSQTALLDALLAALPATEVDHQFEQARSELRNFDRVEPHEAPSGFHGTLRPYQREGLGWFDFLRRFGLGGCLADDMGLGKTVQVLALLESRRAEGSGPSLVVVPRSLVFNWQQEAARFAPALRVLDYTGVGRNREVLELRDQDLVITTYGTLRQDITVLREVDFDYVVLDEAQAIKNATTASAKAARLLRARHRLALTGTPIENRVDELWSLFEFLNPGMLGTSAAFKALARVRLEPRADTDVTAERAELPLLARALRPVILRRTKERVAPELPPKIEQTLMVELEPAQRRVYDELLEHYRRSLLPYVERVGIARSKLRVLEALLRLRQAACHPALIAKTRDDAPSAKLDVLLPKLEEAGSEGHKSLVFSQFTSFLALLRERLDAKKITYAYLDGATRDRESIVERFQQDPACRLFLISLRAGGHGLNLTAADYVFLLDPWWNPAVEAQAIDRAHRIGQHQHVIATRLVARDTIEEKILELQRSKRDLADAILSEDQGTLAQIGREELELLLS